jgi:hypothetical protein
MTDTLDSILAVAAEVVDEYTPDALDTRAGRMAAWLLQTFSFSPGVKHERAGALEKWTVDRGNYSAWRVGSMLGIECCGPVKQLSRGSALALITALASAVSAADADSAVDVEACSNEAED